jgi:hypothetical protein
MAIQQVTSEGRLSWRIGQRVWQWCCRKESLLLVLVPVAVALVLSYLLPQISAHLRADPASYQEWLSARQIEYKTWTPFLKASGAFHIQDTPWFRILLALLAFVTLISLGNQIGLLLRSAAVRRPDAFYDVASAADSADAAALHLLPPPLEHALPQVLRFIENRAKVDASRIRQETNDGKTYIYASRNAWIDARWAAVLLGLLLIVVGVAGNGRWGWRQPAIQILPGKDAVVGPGDDLAIHLLNTESSPSGNDRARLEVEGKYQALVKVGAPAFHRGYRYRWDGRGGPSVQLQAFRVTDLNTPLALYNYTVRPEPEEMLLFAFPPAEPTQESEWHFIVPDYKVVGLLRWSQEPGADESGEPGFDLWIFDEDGTERGKPSFKEQASTGSQAVFQATLEEIIYELVADQYIVLDVAYQPGYWALLAGGALVAVGALGYLISRLQIWARVSPLTTQVEVRMRERRRGISWRPVPSLAADFAQHESHQANGFVEESALHSSTHPDKR